MLEKLKSWLADDTLFIALLLVFIAVGSFGLGRQSVLERVTSVPTERSREIEIIQNTLPASPTLTQEGREVVASKSGTKYHLPSCPGAKQIKEANLIRFAAIELAEAAGYTPAANCEF